MRAPEGRARVTCVGTVEVPLSREAAFPFFTPEGERVWIPGWAPTYPEGGIPVPSAGTVFETEKEGGVATWVVTGWAPEAGEASYAYVLPGMWATLVEVRIRESDAGEGRCVVRVAYHMTSLSPASDAAVRAFEASYREHLAGWARTLAAPGLAEAAAATRWGAGAASASPSAAPS